VNRAGGRSGSLRNIGRIEQWNVGSGASSPIRRVISHRLQSAVSGPSVRRKLYYTGQLHYGFSAEKMYSFELKKYSPVAARPSRSSTQASASS
jgi:hypothetical protein